MRRKPFLTILNVVFLLQVFKFIVIIDRHEWTWRIFIAIDVFYFFFGHLRGQGDDSALPRSADRLLLLEVILGLLVAELLQDVTVQLGAFALPAASGCLESTLQALLVVLVPPRAVVAPEDALLGVDDAESGHHFEPLNPDVELVGRATLVRDAQRKGTGLAHLLQGVRRASGAPGEVLLEEVPAPEQRGLGQVERLVGLELQAEGRRDLHLPVLAQRTLLMRRPRRQMLKTVKFFHILNHIYFEIIIQLLVPLNQLLER